jgi:hypothetical protein
MLSILAEIARNYGSIVLGVLTSTAMFSNANAQFFTPVTNAITNDGTFSSGCSWGDYNNDGYPDLFVWNAGGNNVLYRNNGGGSFTRITTGAIVTDGNSVAAIWADYNNDGYLDLYVSNRGSSFPISGPAQQNFVYMNDGSPNYTFTKITDQVPATDANYTWSSSWVDYNNDGWLDLHVPENLHSADDYFYKNEGSGSFRSLDLPFVVRDSGDPSTGVASWIDYDNDGDQDVLLAKSGRFLPAGAEANRLFQSQLTETGNAESFLEIATGGLVTHLDLDFQASWGDYDNDGDMDVLLGNFDGLNYLYRNDGGSAFSRITGQSIVTDNVPTLGSCWGDYDNDGDLDLFSSTAGGFPARVFRNEGSGNFTRMGFSDLGSITTDVRSSNSCALADYDNDGDLDFYVANSSGGTPQNNDLYHNNQGNNNNWINVTCIGTISNHSAVGAKVRVKSTIFGQSFWQLRVVTGSPTGDRGQNSQRVHFGLGDATMIDSLVIDWPSGGQDVYTGNKISVNGFYNARELQDLDLITSVSETPGDIRPSAFSLKQNHPNPFNPTTSIRYTLASASAVELTIFSMLGQKVRTLLSNQLQSSGDYMLQWNGRNDSGQPVASGLYVYSLKAQGSQGTFSQRRKMVLLK